MAAAALTLGLFEFYRLAKRRDMKPNVVAMFLAGAAIFTVFLFNESNEFVNVLLLQAILLVLIIGTLVAATGPKPTFYRAALIAWAPALGATGYEVQWSRTKYPWRTAGKPYYTAATSVLLEGLTPGTWYYRVRGIDPYVPGPVKEMSWSEPVEIVLAKPRYSVETTTKKPAPNTSQLSVASRAPAGIANLLHQEKSLFAPRSRLIACARASSASPSGGPTTARSG